MKRVFGVDLGGTTIKFSIIDQAGNFIDRWAIPTNTENGGASIPGDIIESLKSKMATLFERGETIEAIGVGVPGPVNGDVVEVAVNLGWNNMPWATCCRRARACPSPCSTTLTQRLWAKPGWAATPRSVPARLSL